MLVRVFLPSDLVQVANEAPADIKSNLTRAWANFDQEKIDGCTKPVEYKACLFSLCWFHSIVLGETSQIRHIKSSHHAYWDSVQYLSCTHHVNCCTVKYVKIATGRYSSQVDEDLGRKGGPGLILSTPVTLPYAPTFWVSTLMRPLSRMSTNL